MKYTAFALAAAGLASAQTWSLCNPVKGETCPANPAFGGDASYDFRNTENIDGLESFFIVDGGVKYNPKVMTFSKDTGAKMTIFEEDNAPTLTSKNYLFFGKVEVELQAAPGQGIVTSIVLQSDSLDEIDWEFVGADQTHVQTNFYALGVNDYTRARYYEVPFNPMTTMHTYTIEWTKESIVFSIDGKVYRTATPAEGNYPQTPMQLKLGTWVGGKGDAQGTIDWAGGLAQWDQAPFAAYYRSLKIWDYAGGDKAGATSYEYNKGSDGKWQSIRVNGAGEKKGGPDGVYKEQTSIESKVPAATTSGSVVKAASTVSSAPSVSSPPVIADVNTTTTVPANATLVTRLTTKAETATGSANAQTTLPTASASARPTEPAPAAASSAQGSVLIAGIAAFFAAMLL